MEYLIVNALIDQQTSLFQELLLSVTQQDCNIEECRVTALGKELAIALLVCGNWNAIAKLETAVITLANATGNTITVKRIKPDRVAEEQLPYQVEVVGLDQPGILYEITRFFISQNVSIEELQTSTYTARLTGAPLFTLTLRITFAANTSISELREQFSLLCEDLNVDGVLEPDKT